LHFAEVPYHFITVIEKYAQNARFCLISNYVSRVIPALQSRCTRFKFKQIPYNAARERIEEILTLVRLHMSEDAVQAVFALSQGDMRRIVNMLQALSLMGKQDLINENDIYDFTGNPTPNDLHTFIHIL
jgi:replication factor C subunit 3/5